jgi:ribonuclease E
MEYLLGIWDAIKKAVVSRPAPFLIFQDSNAIVRALRDHLANDVGEIIVDDTKTVEEARQFMERAMPQNMRKLRMYEDPVPLFTRFQIESQIESAFSHQVTLPAGGSLVIEQTEALVSIDINSARATKGEDIEATAFATNLEAADEVARQCRLRDLGGLLVVDFIDMSSQRNQREVENRLRDAMKMDRARVQIGRISRFGLLELSRQRLRPSLGESAHQPCPRCNGAGHIRGVESLALALLRLIGEEARKDRSAKVIAQLPVDVATYLLNEKRDWIRAIEERDHVQLVLVANPALETPNYTIRRVRDDQVTAPENVGVSYTLAAQEQPPSDAALDLFAPRVKPEEPAVVPPMPATPAPMPAPESVAEAEPAAPARAASKPGLFARLFGWLAARQTEPATTVAEARAPSPAQPQRQDGGRHRGQHGRGRRDERHRGGRGGGGDRDWRQQGEQREFRDQRDQRDQRRQRPERGGQEGGRPNDRGPRPEQSRRHPDQRGSEGQQRSQGGAPGNERVGSTGGGAEQNGQPARRERSRSRRRGRRGGGEDRQRQEQPAGGAEQVPAFGDENPRVGELQSAVREERDFAPDRGEESQRREVEREPTDAGPQTAPPAAEPERERERVASWEPPVPESNPAKTYTVWSSGPADDGNRDRDRGG